VALVETGDGGDEPAEAAVMDAHTVVDELMHEWRLGAQDALCGRERTGGGVR